jgi:hypothetical protein
VSNLPQLQQDWFAALSLVRQAVPWHDVKPVWDAVEDRLHYSEEHQLNAMETKTFGAIRLAFHIEFLPRIERMEMLLYTGCRLSFELQHGTSVYSGSQRLTPREAFQNLCKNAGCDFTNHSNPRARWRDIGFRQGEHLLLVSPFEDRPLCPFCKRPVATGAGAWRETPPEGSNTHPQTGEPRWKLLAALQPEPLWLLIIQERPSEQHFFYRADLHSECWNYASRVLAPQARRQREQEEKEAEAFAKGEQS